MFELTEGLAVSLSPVKKIASAIMANPTTIAIGTAG
jgi:hypothetical protein